MLPQLQSSIQLCHLVGGKLEAGRRLWGGRLDIAGLRSRLLGNRLPGRQGLLRSDLLGR
ncbi:MAG: hypothetical protein HUU20_12905 [Pirellulales bacterium]|nr:hypothetical protein [Pirellulales bacterium]